MENTYAIKDIDGYVKEMRHLAACSYSENYQENLDDFISLSQVKNMVFQHSLGKDDLDRILINDMIHEELFEEISTWLHNVGLAKLAALGKLECAWDEKENSMVFWLPKNTSEKNNEPKRKNKKSGRRDK